MIKSNCIIKIENGKLQSISKYKDGIFLNINEDKYHFPNSFVLPSFTDAHCHIWGLGMKKLGLYFNEAQSAEECCKLSLNNQFKRGNWLIGRGWNEELWSGELPDKMILDKYYSDMPVCFIRVDGHSMWVNSKALEIAQITKDIRVEGGSIELDSLGEPSGILVDNAMDLINKVMPQFTTEQIEKFIRSGLAAGMKSGIMKFHDMDVNEMSHKCLIDLDKEGKLNQKVYSYLTAQHEEYLNYEHAFYNGDNYKVKGIKMYADGALGSHGALLHSKYNDKDTLGLELNSIDEMYRIAHKASLNNYDIAIHAIGDKAVSNVIEVYKKLRNNGFMNILRIEHSQLVQAKDIAEFHKYNIIASVQPIHCISDASMADKRLGKERAAEIAYPWKQFLDNNVMMVAGSDFPIESESVIKGIDAFIHRTPFNSNEPWNSRASINMEQALESYITNPELICGNQVDNFTLGTSADMLVISGDFNNINTWEIVGVVMGNFFSSL